MSYCNANEPMTKHAKHDPTYPVAIGGLGGSGTRVFAALLQHAGFRIGEDLNVALDNLWFTALFKRPEWARDKTPFQPSDIKQSIQLFIQAMTRGLAGNLSPEDAELLARIRKELPPVGAWGVGAEVQNVDNMLAARNSAKTAKQAWGWKEPNTHIFLPHLHQNIANFRYLHIVRNGLDMAFSKNTWQARQWSHLFGLNQAENTPLPLHQLRYWTIANQAAINYGRHMMGNQFLVVDYEDFCARPLPHWERIRAFLGLPETLDFPNDLLRPTTIGRGAKHNISAFPEADLIRAQDLQTLVESIGQPRERANPAAMSGELYV